MKSESEFWSLLEGRKQQIDCLILQNASTLPHLFNELKQQCVLLPTIVINLDRLWESDKLSVSSEDEDGVRETNLLTQPSQSHLSYHTATVNVGIDDIHALDLHTLEQHIHQAIDQFVNLSKDQVALEGMPKEVDGDQTLTLQQNRLIEKLRERLGYLGVYYKRNPKNFLRNMSSADQQDLMKTLRQDYREIVLSYFSNDVGINQQIDAYVDMAFFADIPVSQIVEIHMDLMDEFSKQLQLEGRGEEILLDYRLTLIDVIAHLCEMYRRSIPRSTVGENA